MESKHFLSIADMDAAAAAATAVFDLLSISREYTRVCVCVFVRLMHMRAYMLIIFISERYVLCVRMSMRMKLVCGIENHNKRINSKKK